MVFKSEAPFTIDNLRSRGPNTIFQLFKDYLANKLLLRVIFLLYDTNVKLFLKVKSRLRFTTCDPGNETRFSSHSKSKSLFTIDDL